MWCGLANKQQQTEHLNHEPKEGGSTLAEAMRLRAMLPLASTRKMTSAPAFLASRLLHAPK